MRVEHEYHRAGAWTYLAAWDVHRAKLFGRCETKNGIGPVDRLVAEVMDQPPYRSARRVFWIMDNGSAHRGQKAADRLRSQWPSVVLVHTPLHASWLNQIEIYFSIVQRKVLIPNDFSSLAEVEEVCLPFNITMSKSPSLSTGLSPAGISQPSWRGSATTPWPMSRNPPHEYVTVITNRST